MALKGVAYCVVCGGLGRVRSSDALGKSRLDRCPQCGGDGLTPETRIKLGLNRKLEEERQREETKVIQPGPKDFESEEELDTDILDEIERSFDA